MARATENREVGRAGGRPVGGARGRVGRAVRWVLIAKAAGLAGYLVFVRPRLLRWGATAGEVARALPGDDIVPRPHLRATRAITIDAPPEAVWPWLVQMGAPPRAGWYGYELVEGRPSTDHIIPELQKLQVGDVLPTGPDGAGYTVERIEPERVLLLTVRGFYVTLSWAMVLFDLGGRTRMLFRLRVRCRPGLLGTVYFLATESGDFLTTRKQMTTIKHLAERRWHTSRRRRELSTTS
jgi:hypothetical protein